MRLNLTPRRIRRIIRWLLILTVLACVCGYCGFQFLLTLPEVIYMLTPPTPSPAP